VQSLLAQTADPEAPYEVNVSQRSDVLTARAAAAGAFDSLFLGEFCRMACAQAPERERAGGRQLTDHEHLRAGTDRPSSLAQR
jgi:hypothetical protein